MRHSDRESFNNCPQAYRYRQDGLIKIEESASSNHASWGSAIHKGLEAHYKGVSAKDAEIAKLRGELQSQAEVMEKMREALEFYAHENNYDDETGAIGRYVGGGHIAGEIYEPHFEPEYGETAKKVLALLMPNSVSRLEKKDNPHA